MRSAQSSLSERAGRTTVNQFSAINYSISRNEVASLHRAGCGDIKKDQQEHAGSVQPIEAADADHAVSIWLDAEMVEMGYSRRDIKVKSCAKEIK